MCKTQRVYLCIHVKYRTKQVNRKYYVFEMYKTFVYVLTDLDVLIELLIQVLVLKSDIEGHGSKCGHKKSRVSSVSFYYSHRWVPRSFL